jgi:PTS system nitrogen regulatory IIA component
MPYRNMTLEDFAKHVGMDARDVRRLADRGKLPAQKVAGVWRFNRARVTEWLQQEMPSLDHDRLIEIEQAMGVRRSMGDNMAVTSLLGLEGIDVMFAANTKASVLRELVNLAERTGLLYDPKGLLEALQERESLCSTALPNGVALPHPRQPMPYVSAEPLICVARPTRGIGFGSADGKLTRLFFLLCCHDDRHHLRVLARLVRLLDEQVVSGIMEAETRGDVLHLLIEQERKLAAETP